MKQLERKLNQKRVGMEGRMGWESPGASYHVIAYWAFLATRSVEPRDIGATCFVRGGEARVSLQEVQFSNCLVELLRKFIRLRRKGQGFLPTHPGRVLRTRQLYETDIGELLCFHWSL